MRTVTLPVWVFAIVAALALWAVLDRLVIPVKIADLARRPLCPRTPCRNEQLHE
jgi:hypothetical protein